MANYFPISTPGSTPCECDTTHVLRSCSCDVLRECGFSSLHSLQRWTLKPNHIKKSGHGQLDVLFAQLASTLARFFYFASSYGFGMLHAKRKGLAQNQNQIKFAYLSQRARKKAREDDREVRYLLFTGLICGPSSCQLEYSLKRP